MNALDELRQMADLQERGRAFVEIGQLRDIADRIESEWMELPRDKDGEVIHVGEDSVERIALDMLGELAQLTRMPDDSHTSKELADRLRAQGLEVPE